LFLALPFRLRLRIGENMRAKSLARPMGVSPKYDVTHEAVSQLFGATHTRTMIHGHTHLPARHEHHGAVRWVLPDWELDRGTPRGGYMRIDETGIRVLPLDTPQLAS
jgi:UDP-2,3-diacylglucosamine hydrolase